MSVSQWRRRVSAVVAPSLLLISYLKHFQQDGVSSFPSSFDVRARLSTTKEGKQLNMDMVIDMSHSQMLGKVDSGGGPIFKVVLEC